MLALVGESGCGKTTLARTIMGLERPAEGEVVFEGEPLRYDGRFLRDYRGKVQMVFQDPMGSLNPRQTVYEAVAEGLRIQKRPGRRGDRVSRTRSRAPGSVRRSASSTSTRTSSRAGSASAS